MFSRNLQQLNITQKVKHKTNASYIKWAFSYIITKESNYSPWFKKTSQTPNIDQFYRKIISASWSIINGCHNSIPCPNSSIVFVASVRMSTKELNDARRNLASTASKCLYQKDGWEVR
jgi:hypothetical protein